MGGVTTHFRKHTIDSLLDRGGKKEMRISQIGDTWKARVETSKARSETSKARIEALLTIIERYKSEISSEATSADTNDFSVTKCTTTSQTIELLYNEKKIKGY